MRSKWWDLRNVACYGLCFEDSPGQSRTNQHPGDAKHIDCPLTSCSPLVQEQLKANSLEGVCCYPAEV